MLTVGVDPGLSGAVAVIGPDGEFCAGLLMPTEPDGRGQRIPAAGEVIAFLRGMRDAAPCEAVVEEVRGYRQDSADRAFRFGRNWGVVLVARKVAFIPIVITPRPKTWKEFYGLSSDKGASLALARSIWPDAPLRRKKDEALAEALLIARYGQRLRRAG